MITVCCYTRLGNGGDYTIVGIQLLVGEDVNKVYVNTSMGGSEHDLLL